MSAPVASALIAVGFIANLMFTTRVAHGDNATIDADGVAMLFPSASGASFRLGSEDPNQSRRFKIEKGSAVAHSEGPLHFWTTDAYDLDYASGGEGRTSRLHIYASGGKQQFTWQSQHGYLARPDDVRNQELTVYARVRGLSDAKRAAVALKIRGGAHSKSAPEKASCVMLTFQMASTGAVTRFGKELDHPLYDYVTLEPKLSVALGEGQWYGFKVVSFSSMPKHVINRLYIDMDPVDPATGRPANNWRLLSEYEDVDGKSTGKYASVVDWGGWQTTFRTDGFRSLDFMLVSLREIIPPQ